MNSVLEIITLGIMAFIFIQDLKYRAIHIILPIATLVLGGLFFYRSGLEIKVILVTSIFLFITLLGLYIYLIFKERKFVSPSSFMGPGDLFFFVALIPFFSTSNYVFFFITSMLFSILCFFIMTQFVETKLVPLAGLIALYFILLRGLTYVSHLDFYQTQFI